MGNRENYDPEDIEVLLQERTFDELLPEERAFVLKHLSGRAEYERMRALLGQLQRNEQRPSSVVADPVVKDRVMEVFRAQQRPTWRVWLNTVHAFLLPEDTASLWRPALAFASIALLVTVSVIGYRNYIADEQAQLAEVRREKAETPVPKVPEPVVTEPMVSESVEETNTALEIPVPAIEEVQAEKELQEVGPNVTQSTRELQAAEVEYMDDVAKDAAAPMRDEMDFAPAAPATSGATHFNYTAADVELSKQTTELYAPVQLNEVSLDAVSTRSANKAGGKAKKEGRLQDVTNSKDLAANTNLAVLLQPGW